MNWILTAVMLAMLASAAYALKSPGMTSINRAALAAATAFMAGMALRGGDQLGVILCAITSALWLHGLDVRLKRVRAAHPAVIVERRTGDGR